jgi:hypothetical protein
VNWLTCGSLDELSSACNCELGFFFTVGDVKGLTTYGAAVFAGTIKADSVTVCRCCFGCDSVEYISASAVVLSDLLLVGAKANAETFTDCFLCRSHALGIFDFNV